ncbi:hypothetical protein TRVA0_063S00276 [Trichomonascus vanleenenianus]|uniref:uncharacterized protein n=1 Tax=Trichomonascus vanleenenianus TaxID=2268995 RepID=UPI003EC9A5A8
MSKPPIRVVIEVLDDKNGKDKTLKLIQYVCKLIIWYAKSGKISKALLGPISKIASGFSLFRAIMRMFNWMEPVYNLGEMLLSSKRQFGLDLIVELLDFSTAVTDDISCLKKMGVITNKQFVAKAEKQGAWTWFLSILINLRKEHAKYRALSQQIIALEYRQQRDSEKHDLEEYAAKRKKIEDAMYWSRVSFWKLMSDGAFCFFDVFEPPLDAVIQTLAGLSSGILAYHKIYAKKMN